MRDQQVLYAKTAELGGLQNTIDFFRRKVVVTENNCSLRDLPVLTPSETLGVGTGTVVKSKYDQAHCLSESCPKNGNLPKLSLP